MPALPPNTKLLMPVRLSGRAEVTRTDALRHASGTAARRSSSRSRKIRASLMMPMSNCELSDAMSPPPSDLVSPPCNGTESVLRRVASSDDQFQSPRTVSVWRSPRAKSMRVSAVERSVRASLGTMSDDVGIP